MSNFLRTSDLTRAELEELIESAFRFKLGDVVERALSGRSVALVFFNPSLRTRASMQVGIFELGGNAVILEPGGTSWPLEYRENVVMDTDKSEHLKEFVAVLERYVSAIGVRVFAEMKDWEAERTDPVLSAFETYATKSVINLESAMHHPCQALADMMTIRERLGVQRKKVLLTWAWHPKPLPMAVPNSFALASAQMGHDLVIAHPEGYELDKELMSEVRQQANDNGGSVEITNQLGDAFDRADVVFRSAVGSVSVGGRRATVLVVVVVRGPRRANFVKYRSYGVRPNSIQHPFRSAERRDYVGA